MRFLLSILPLICFGQIQFITHGDYVVGNRNFNLISNGSFETGDFNTGFNFIAGNGQNFSTPYWNVTGSTLCYPFIYHTGNYVGSGAIPDGTHHLYMGNGSNAQFTNNTKIDNSNGVWDFKGNTLWNPDGAMSVHQVKSLSGFYVLDFWLSGEYTVSGNYHCVDGVLAVRIGDSTVYLVVPSCGNNAGFGASERFQIYFYANGSTVIGFYNYGHIKSGGSNTWAYPYNLSAFMTTEAVIDDVILNQWTILGVSQPTYTQRRDKMYYSDDKVIIEVKQPERGILEIFNSQGGVVLKKEMVISRRCEVYCNWPAGAYTVKFNSKTLKFVKWNG